MRAAITGIGVLGPGLPDWSQGRSALAGASPYLHAPLGRVVAPGLPRTEARRATLATHLALTVAEQALHGHDSPDAAMPSVWAAADSDLQGLERNCRSLAEEPPWISPHRFQNSVHNTPAGYWSIATGCRGPATALCAGSATAAAGLVEALTMLVAGHERCLLVVYDELSPPVLEHARAVPFSFAAALLLAQPGDGGGREVALAALPAGAAQESVCRDPGLEELRRGNPAARLLPLLEALAGRTAATVELAGSGQDVRLQVMEES